MVFTLGLLAISGATNSYLTKRANSLFLPTPIKIRNLEIILEGYDRAKADFLVSGCNNGFSIHCHGLPNLSEPRNLASALAHPHVVDRKLSKELAAHRLAGPFKTTPLPEFCVSPLGVVPKKQAGEFRLIHHLSFPKGFSVNDYIPEEYSTVTYATIGKAIALIKKAGQGCFMAKTDICNAFRLIPIQPQDYHLLGMKWKDSYYYDRCMPMGCSSSCQTFEAFSTAVEWVAKNKLFIDLILHLLDDFFLAAKTHQLCKKQLDLFLSLCDFLNIPMAPDKTVGPATVLSFAGIELDSVAMVARLPADKVPKCREHISSLLRRKKVALKELQSLCGLLNFACSVITPARAFLRRLIDLTIGVRADHHKIRLTQQVKADLNVWFSFLEKFNGQCVFQADIWQTSNKLKLFTDAAGSLGFGAIFGRHWCYESWPAHWRQLNIATLELYPIILSMCLWGHTVKNQSILFFTDNAAVVDVINKQSCRDKSLMSLIRKLVLVCLEHNISFKAKHIPGVHNKLADALSRLQVAQFKQMAPADMEPQSNIIPAHLLPQNWPV